MFGELRGYARDQVKRYRRDWRRGSGGDPTEQGSTDAAGFDEGRGLGVARGEVGARGALVLESFQILESALKSSLMARRVDGKGLQGNARLGVLEGAG